MIATGSHNNSMSEDDFTAFYPLFEQFVKQEVQIWKEFHSYWGEGVHCIPTYFVKYEDLMNHKKDTVKGILCFLLNAKSIDGTLIEALMLEKLSDSN